MVFLLPVAAQVLVAAQDRVLVRPQNASPSPTYLNRMQASGVEGAQDAGSRREVREGEGRSEVRMARARAREKANPLLVWGTTVTRAMMMMMMMTSRRDGGQDYYWVLGTLAVCPLEDMKTASRRAWPGGLAAAGASVVEWRTGPFSQKPWISITCMFYIEGELDLDFLPLYQSPLQASPILTALRSSWGRIYVPTVVPHRRPYEITFDMFFFSASCPGSDYPGGWRWDAMVKMIRYYFNIMIPMIGCIVLQHFGVQTFFFFFGVD